MKYVKKVKRLPGSSITGDAFKFAYKNFRDMVNSGETYKAYYMLNNERTRRVLMVLIADGDYGTGEGILRVLEKRER